MGEGQRAHLERVESQAGGESGLGQRVGQRRALLFAPGNRSLDRSCGAAGPGAEGRAD